MRFPHRPGHQPEEFLWTPSIIFSSPDGPVRGAARLRTNALGTQLEHHIAAGPG